MEPWTEKKKKKWNNFIMSANWYKKPKKRFGDRLLRRSTSLARGWCQREKVHQLAFILINFPLPPSQAPLNNEWKLSHCIYKVPYHGLVNLTWQFSDEEMIWTGMCRAPASWFRELSWFWSLGRLAAPPRWLTWAALEIK